MAGAAAEAIRGDRCSAWMVTARPRSSRRTAVLSPTTPAPMTAIGEASCWRIQKEYELRACEFGLACDSVFGAKQPHHPDRRYPVGWKVAGRFILSMQSPDGLCAPPSGKQAERRARRPRHTSPPGRIAAQRSGVVQAFVSRPPGYSLHNRQIEHPRRRPPLARSKAVSAGLGSARTAVRAGGVNSRTCRAGRYVYVGLSIASGYRYAPTIRITPGSQDSGVVVFATHTR